MELEHLQVDETDNFLLVEDTGMLELIDKGEEEVEPAAVDAGDQGHNFLCAGAGPVADFYVGLVVNYTELFNFKPDRRGRGKLGYWV